MDTRHRLFAWAAALALLLAGCGTDEQAPLSPESEQPGETAQQQETHAPAEGERLYRANLGDSFTWVVDSDGNPVAADPDEPAFIELDDPLTGEAYCQYLRRYEVTGVDEWGNITYDNLVSLYDMDGGLLLDWENKSYGAAFGEYILRQDDRSFVVDAMDLAENYRSVLYHLPTGEESREGAFNVWQMGEVFLLTDQWGSPLGVVDAGNNDVADFPVPGEYYSAFPVTDSLLTVSDTNPYEYGNGSRVEYLMDLDFNVLLTAEWISGVYGHILDDCVAYRDGDHWGVFHPQRGTVFETQEGSVEYYDGRLVIVEAGSYRDEQNPINASLVTVEGEVLAGGFRWLTSAQGYYDEEPAQRFLGILGDDVVLLDREGAVTASITLPDARAANFLADGFYTYSVETDDYYGDGLLGADLAHLIPAGTYDYFEVSADNERDYSTWTDRELGFLIRAQKGVGTSDELGNRVWRWDIFDSGGALVADNLTSIYDVGPDRILVERGFEIVLMDWQGNRITSRSMFQGFGDD